ncbi:mechanosensitive ion channel family protein [Parvularcula sp. ZS-1/3]|uniref:Small-conductance mechanosensitive channel n=1 Tax=Parvularcula mediterranea TaxID=2732508 RepID=A0A7Y3RK81_9PROT|nr:mechanosensitive ion channel family protein [Parvularcula mediterranea]NNU15195.1 mechanosensitive ion channel family protein [Parvularcula mediterranea]
MQDQQNANPENPGASPTADAAKPSEVTSISDLPGYLTERFADYWDGALALTPKLVVVAVILLITWVIARTVRLIVGWLANRADTRQSLKDLFKTLSGVGVWLFGGFAALTVLFPSINAGSIVAGLGVGGIVIGIAFQDIFKNFMAGVLILARKTMAIGDYIQADGVEGRIEHITLRDTYLRRVDGELVLVPNAHLFENPVRVWTDPDYRRYDIVAGVGYDEDVAHAREVIQGALDKLDFGADKKPQVFAAEFGASSINFNVRWWARPEPLDMHESRDKVVQAIKEALDNAGIEIPFPYRTLTFKEPLPVRSEGDGGGSETERLAAE